MNIQTRKLNIIQYLSHTTNTSVIKMIESIIKKEDVDFWDTLSIGQKEEIDEAIAELDAGKGIPHDVVMKQVKARLKQKLRRNCYYSGHPKPLNNFLTSSTQLLKNGI